MSQSAFIDPYLLQKYDLPAPRELAFPPLALFRTGFGETAYRDQINQSNGDPIPRSLSLDLKLLPSGQPGSFHQNRFSSLQWEAALAESEQAYLAALEREIRIKGRLFDGDRQVVDLNIDLGSGKVSPGYLGRLCTVLERYFYISPAARRSITLPTEVATPGLGIALAECRFNSVKLVCSQAPGAIPQLKRFVDAARSNGFRRVAIDVCYSVGQDLPSTLTALSGFAPDEIQLRCGATPSGKQDPSPGHRAKRFCDARTLLLDCGYTNEFGARFSRSQTPQYSDACGFCSTDRVGLGLSALSWSGGSYCQNESRLSLYCASLATGRLPIQRGVELSADHCLRREVVRSLLCSGSLDIPAFEAHHGVAFAETFARELGALEPMADDGLLRVSPKEFALLTPGRILVDRVVRVFDGEGLDNVLYVQFGRDQLSIPTPQP